MKIGKPIKYIAVPPEEVLERVKKNIQADAQVQTKQLDDLSKTDILSELNLLHTKGVDMVDPTELTGALKGRNNAYSQLDAMIKGAEKTIILSTTAEGIIRKTEVLGRSLKKAAERGVTIQVAVPINASNKDEIKMLSEFADVRDVKKAAGRFCIADSKEVLFMLMGDEDVHPTYDVGIWLSTPYFANTMEQLFNSVWSELKVAR